MSCNYQLKWYDLVPIFSWIILKGKCRECKSKISVQYPLVELSTGILFVLLFWSTLPFIEFPSLIVMSFVWNAIIFSILTVIFVYDIYHKIIPNSLSYAFAILALIQAILISTAGEMTIINILDLLSGLIMFLPFFLLWFVSRGKWIGLGDGKLALGIGWYLGFVNGLSAIILAFWIGAIFSVVLMLIDNLKLRGKKITMKTEIPFAPFLIIGVIIEFFIRVDFLGIGLFF